MTDRELMQQALNVLKIFVDGGNSAWARKIIEIKEALRDRLAQPEQEHSEQWWKHEVSNAWAEGYEKGRASVKQPEQEPVAQVDYNERGNIQWLFGKQVPDKTLLYTAPPQRDEAPAKAVEWQGLTDEEMRGAAQVLGAEPLAEGWKELIKFASAIEQALKEKNA